MLLAISGQVAREGKLLISSNAGPSTLAGKACNKNVISLSWQNDQTPEAMGKYMQEAGIKSAYLMAPNYQAGKDMLAGFKRYYKGDIVAEIYTKLGQSDFQAELSALRAARPEATFVFQPGGMGINFVKQWAQADMDRASKLYSVFTIDNLTLPALGEYALGTISTQTWSPDLDTPMNKKFVADYKASYGAYPSFYAAQAYDTIMAINYAEGRANSKNTDEIPKILAAGNIPTTRGKLDMNTNQFPIQNIYLRKTVPDNDGVITTKIIRTVFENHHDAYAKDCSYK